MERLTQKLGMKTRGVISIIGAGGKSTLMFRLARELSAQNKKVLSTTTTKIFLPTPDQSPLTIITTSFDNLIKQAKSGLSQYSHISAGRLYDPSTEKLWGFEPGVIHQLEETRIFDWIIVEADGARQKPLKASNSNEPVLPDVSTHLVLVTGLDAVGKPLLDAYVHRAMIFSRNTGLAIGEKMSESAVARSCLLEMRKAAGLCPGALKVFFLNKADTIEQQCSGMRIMKKIKTSTVFQSGVVASLKNENGPGINPLIISSRSICGEKE